MRDRRKTGGKIHPSAPWMLAPDWLRGRAQGAEELADALSRRLQYPEFILAVTSAFGIFLSLLGDEQTIAFVDDKQIDDFPLRRVNHLRAAEHEFRNERSREQLLSLPFGPLGPGLAQCHVTPASPGWTGDSAVADFPDM